jgi:intein/homing endonuclease
MVRRYTLNEDYFSNWSPEMAYIMGFTIADGYVDKNSLKFCIHDKDIELLHFFQSEIDCRYPLKRYNKKRQEYVSLSIHSQKIVKSLASYGILSNKRETWHGFSDSVPQEYRADIVRGFFDGDGWVCTKRTKSDKLHLSSGFANKSLDWLRQVKEWSGIVGGYIGKRPTWYQLCFGNRDSLALRAFMYQNSFSLSRKRFKFFTMSD